MFTVGLSVLGNACKASVYLLLKGQTANPKGMQAFVLHAATIRTEITILTLTGNSKN